MTQEEVISRYGELQARVDEKFAEIHARYPAAFRCREGCHSCCKPNLTVNRLEAASIALFLRDRPELIASLRELAAANPFRAKRCSFLNAAGACGIYEARPLVCRSHGAPIQFKEGGGEDAMRLRDVCGLNFTGLDIGALPADAVFNLDTLNTLLALLSSQAYGKDVSRVPLSLNGILP
ncbi:MAG: YkgJ family cysteine cluster protein [Proteobacteria bacterium]|nr:MAG: YkgJ family cysteine cluster protein [Pseudomonadota bacterium]